MRETEEGQSPSTTRKPTVVGLYGISGCGKTTLLNSLKRNLGEKQFSFYDGSVMLDKLVDGGLGAFKEMGNSIKQHWREQAVKAIGTECAENGRTGVVAGHLMLWNQQPEPVYTKSDMETYTHIIYLNVAPEEVADRRKQDSSRTRPNISTNDLSKWQEVEMIELRKLCPDHNILLFNLKHPVLETVPVLLRDIAIHTKQYNLVLAENAIDEMMVCKQGHLQTVLVLDGDKTLAPNDTGSMFWETRSQMLGLPEIEDPLKKLFSSKMKYSYAAFRQAMFLYEEAASDEQYEIYCHIVSAAVTMHPDFISLLKQVAKQTNVGAVVVTSGLRRVWENVLEREGLFVKVIGGGRISDRFVVTGSVKAALVTRLRDVYKQKVWVFGDSPLDLDMMRKADRAVVVVGEEHSRSKSMEEMLCEAVDEGLRAHQVLLPVTAPPRLNTTKIPLMQLAEVIPNVFSGHVKYLHATDKNAAKILATPTRDAKVSGPALREAHRRIGWYLATEYLSKIIGTEEYEIPHVTGGSTEGYRFLGEKQTTIVALMRGGEPMALGVSDAIPDAMFVHTKGVGDLKPQHFVGQSTVILVDSVINTGKSILEFLQHIHELHATIRVVIVAGVVQGEVIDRGIFNAFSNITLVALRRSGRKFTGKGGTDTGNRLFNTTELD